MSTACEQKSPEIFLVVTRATWSISRPGWNAARRNRVQSKASFLNVGCERRRKRRPAAVAFNLKECFPAVIEEEMREVGQAQHCHVVGVIIRNLRMTVFSKGGQ